MKVVVIVVTFNGLLWIDKCFDSLIKSSIPLQILAIDNASSDGTCEYIRQHFKNIELIETGYNLGFGKANNIGLKKALEENADYVFLLNQDAWIETDTIENLVKITEINRDYGIISPFHYNWSGDKVDNYFLSMANPLDCPDFLSDYFLKTSKDIYTIKFIHAACWLITRQCLLTVGGFDPLFYHYGEDNDYAERAKYFNFKIGIVPRSYVYHYGFFDTTKPNLADSKFKRIAAINKLKTLESGLFGNYVYFLKSSFDKFSTLLMSRKIKNAFIEISFSIGLLKLYHQINASRKKSKQKKAFL